MDYFKWGIDPVFVSLGGIQVHWYGVLFGTAFILGFYLMKWIYLRENKNVQDLERLLFYLIAGTIVGSRLGHCLFYNPAYYLNNPVKIFAIWEGGLASHGGGIGVLISLYLYRRSTQASYLWLLDRLAIPTALAAFFIRVGNFFNSEIVGIPSSVPWAIVFERVDLIPRHPAQIYEALSYALIFILLLVLYRQDSFLNKRGILSGMFLVMVFTSRFFIEFVKTKQEAYSTEFWMSPGQILSLPFVAIGFTLVLVAMFRKRSIQL